MDFVYLQDILGITSSRVFLGGAGFRSSTVSNFIMANTPWTKHGSLHFAHLKHVEKAKIKGNHH